MTLSPDQRDEIARRLGPSSRPAKSARFRHQVKNGYPTGYLAQLARPFTSRRGPGGIELQGKPPLRLPATVR
jgi:hypothetical protein